MVRLDLHTHSTYSPDGGLDLADYRAALKTKLDYIAVTDHDTTRGALKLKRVLGGRIIVGQEISSLAGEIIGLYLKSDVAPGLSAEETVRQIHAQGGLVLVPHPFERWQRFSLFPVRHPQLIRQFDIIETYNSRSISIAGPLKSRRFARRHNLPQAASSDAHGPAGLGRSYTLIKSAPTRDNLLGQLKAARLVTAKTTLTGYLEPARNRRAKIRSNSRG